MKQRPRPDYDALGIRAGAFLLYPKVEVTASYEDNVFATERNAVDDHVLSLSPSLSVISQWSRHEVQAYARANAYRYGEYDLQNATTYSVGGSGRLDVTRGAALTAALSYAHLVEPRTSASSPDDAAEPIEYDQASLDLGGVREFNRIRLAAKLHYRDYTFQDNRTARGARIDTSYRDNRSIEAEVRGDYALSPSLAIYATASRNNWEFATPTRGEINRDADGYQVAIGADFELTRLVRGQVQAGYLDQNFSDPVAKDTTGLSVLARVEYFPTQLLTITGTAERAVQATGVTQAAAVLHAAASIQADYELRRNLILSGSLQRFTDDYQGVDRNDQVWGAMLGAYYLVNRRVGVNAIYNHYAQDSSGLARGRIFDTNRVQVGVVVQY